jgi:ABC-type nitrate/sulfonate/bicarbonate transport system substrate-binding protein
LIAAVGLLSVSLNGAARAEADTVRIAKQFGLGYLPLTMMEEEKLFEQQAKKQGLDIKVEWLRLSAGAPMNDAILSGNLDFASGGVGPLLTIWGKTQTNVMVKGVAALNSMPLYLVTTNSNIKTIKDYTEKDKIALPGVKTSIQAVTLQIAAEKVFGKGGEGKLDAFTVSMSHPDALASMLGGKSEINSHFGSAPFQEMELADPRVHKVLDSYGVGEFEVRDRKSENHESLPRRARGKHDPHQGRSRGGGGDLGQGGEFQTPCGGRREDHQESAERMDDHSEENPDLSRLHESGWPCIDQDQRLERHLLQRHPRRARQLAGRTTNK